MDEICLDDDDEELQVVTSAVPHLGAGWVPRPSGPAVGAKRPRVAPSSLGPPRPRPSSRGGVQDKVVLSPTPKTGWVFGKGNSRARPPAAWPRLPDLGKGLAKTDCLATTAKSKGATPAKNGAPPEQLINGIHSLSDKTAAGVPVFLAPATAHIVPISSRSSASSSTGPSWSKRIAMQFVSADQPTQMRMLKDPHVARAILETLDDRQLGSAGGVQQQAVPSEAPTVPSDLAPAWAGSLVLARNMGKRLVAKAALVHGRVADVEVALRCAAGNYGVLDITHRMAFEEIARRASSGTLLSLEPNSSNEIASLEEYTRYFRSKMRAGVARLDEALSLYVLPPAEDILCLRNTVYSLSPHIPRSGCLLGLIAAGTAPIGLPPGAASSASREPAGEQAAGPRREASSTASAASPLMQKASASAGASAEGDACEGDNGMAPGELLGLFSNPELIKLLSDDASAEP